MDLKVQVLLCRFSDGGYDFNGTVLEAELLPDEWMHSWIQNFTTILTLLKVSRLSDDCRPRQCIHREPGLSRCFQPSIVLAVALHCLLILPTGRQSGLLM